MIIRNIPERTFKKTKTILEILTTKTGLLTIYLFFILGYCWIYAPYGLENNDGGFILGLSYQLSQGLVLYEEIINAKPPMSIIIHAINFLYPFDLAPILSSRIFFFFQIAVYSALTSVLFARYFHFSHSGALFLSIASFIFNAHNFPPMAWFTVDGIFFSIIAIYFAATFTNDRKILRGLLAFVFAYAAAMSKQPFYITPIVIAFLMLYPAPKRYVALTLACSFTGGLLIYLFITSMLDVTLMYEAIYFQHSKEGLISSGIIDYIMDWLDLRTILTAGPLAAALLFWNYTRLKEKKLEKAHYLGLFLVLSIIVYMASILQIFMAANKHTYPTMLIDSVFTVTAVISLLNMVKTKDHAWVVLTAMHAISWAASISWGYRTTALFSSPSLIVTALALHNVFEGHRLVRFGPFVAITAILVILYAGNQFLYSFEGSVRRQEASVRIDNEFPSLYGIMVTEQQAAALRELALLKNELPDDIIVVPNWPLYNVIFGGSNPIGMDWLINSDVGPYGQLVKDRIERVTHALVFRDAPSSPVEGIFGSRLTQWIVLNWEFQDRKTKYFDVYENPSYTRRYGQ